MLSHSEEEIIATSIGEELICTSNPDDEDFKYLPNNAYVIQSSVDRAEVPDKPSKCSSVTVGPRYSFLIFVICDNRVLALNVEPIKLLIKRVESEDEVPACPDSDSSVTRAKSKRAWNSRLVVSTDSVYKRFSIPSKCVAAVGKVM